AYCLQGPKSCGTIATYGHTYRGISFWPLTNPWSHSRSCALFASYEVIFWILLILCVWQTLRVLLQISASRWKQDVGASPLSSHCHGNLLSAGVHPPSSYLMKCHQTGRYRCALGHLKGSKQTGLYPSFLYSI